MQILDITSVRRGCALMDQRWKKNDTDSFLRKWSPHLRSCHYFALLTCLWMCVVVVVAGEWGVRVYVSGRSDMLSLSTTVNSYWKVLDCAGKRRKEGSGMPNTELWSKVPKNHFWIRLKFDSLLQVSNHSDISRRAACLLKFLSINTLRRFRFV